MGQRRAAGQGSAIKPWSDMPWIRTNGSSGDRGKHASASACVQCQARPQNMRTKHRHSSEPAGPGRGRKSANSSHERVCSCYRVYGETFSF